MINKYFLLTSVLIFIGLNINAQVSLNFSTAKRGPLIGDTHYGIFYEEINHAGDGGIYAELVRNGSMEENSSNPDYWWTLGSASYSISTTNLLNGAQTKAMKLVLKKANDGTRNIGFWGIHIVKGQTYKAKFWVRTENDWSGNLTLKLENESGTSLGSKVVQISDAGQWKKYEAEITATGSDNQGWFAIRGSKAGTIYLDCVSLFPPTFKDRENGMRPDLAQKLADLHPRFMRFPGGCYIEGGNRYQWKHTVGPVEERTGIYNSHWGYVVTNGMGFYEFLQLAEDLGAQPLFVVNVGMGHGWYEDYQHIQGYIEEALDAIEYCNGDTTTYWGKKRAEAGHPEPFNLRLMEIGNENYNYTSNGNSDQSDHYAERYKQFYDAIHEKYPYITFIGNTDWGSDYPTWRNPYPVDLVDEHFYRSPDWFAGMYHKYDNYSRTSNGIYCGEYAVTSDYGTYGTLKAALGEAIFMAGMEVNSDVVKQASYAPIFVNENAVNWSPDMIRYNAYTSFGTPSYWAQQMMAQNVGHQNITWTEDNNTLELSDKYFGVGSWNTDATYSNIKVIDANGDTIYTYDGTVNSPSSTTGTYKVFKDVELSDCTIEMDAVKNSGNEGFLVTFAYADGSNYAWWNIGGWTNSAHAIEQAVSGTKSNLNSTSGSVTTGQTYHLKVVREGSDVKCYMDGELKNQATLKSNSVQALYTCASLNEAEDTAIVKVINYNGVAIDTKLNFTDAEICGDAPMRQMNNLNNYAENSMSTPNLVKPKDRTATFDSTTPNILAMTIPAYSLSVIQIPIKNASPEQKQVAEELPAAQCIYDFEQGKACDKDEQYTGTINGNAEIKTLDDGNKVLYTGDKDGKGYLNLGNTAAKAIANTLNTNNWTVSTNLLIDDGGNYGSYSWAWSINNSTTSYYGLVNQPNNLNWYFEKVKSNTTTVKSGSGLSQKKWHNVTVTCDGATIKLYIDAQLRATGAANTNDIATTASANAWIARSPFSGDAYMTNTFFDDFAIYAEALSERQVLTLYNNAIAKSTTLPATEPEPTETNAKAIEVIGEGNEVDITSLLTNPDFSDGTNGWEGTLFSAAPGTVAEQFSKIFDTFQVLENMPAGTYRLEWQGFYRDGETSNAYNRHENGTENLAEAYVACADNGMVTYTWKDLTTQPMTSLYADESYTYSPYNYPNNVTEANTAFTEGKYVSKTANFILPEIKDLRIGFRKEYVCIYDWLCIDNVKLYYISNSVDPSAIQNIVKESKGNNLFYDLQGRIINTPSKGIYIYNGKKVLVK